AAGSGAVIHPAGYILTNDHVIMAGAGNKDRPQGLALFADGSQYIFKILARLPAEDIAILKIETGKPLPFLSLGRSHDLVLGEPTLVIGNPSGLAHSVSTGIVSGLQRSTSTSTSYLPAVVQTTAPISGGSSGSPLINALGQISGVSTSQHDSGQNLNFAITIDHIRSRFPRLINAENLNGFLLGVELDMLEPGAKITRVAPNSPAARENLQPGDLITGAGGRKITSVFVFHLALMN
ncbi:MAG: S1C family serine protease, partial [Planctomycetes bacterium]|nr:S1C family serine protease [Planctomycetota bacterium]